ncbi:MAG: hypothetical protein WBE72_21020 [Terracidiphilus sp.]
MNTAVDKYDILKGAIVAGPDHEPKTLAELGVRESILEDIALKVLYLPGPFSVADLSEQSRLSYDAAEQLLNRLETMLLCEVTGMIATVRVDSNTRSQPVFPLDCGGVNLERHAGVRIRWQNPQSRMAVKLTCWQRLDARLRYAAQRGIVSLTELLDRQSVEVQYISSTFRIG